ncbi:aldehyde dehydrogenase family protein [Wenzhouxiangella sp. XN79A]|uniref:aldehyde dehydrogenase family protein n=1 Tax=Wenzhouxiangella sp. XN79A TaxID=2724193 RepID=UPI00144A7869|nr:aldehyde dehydrogenase family protein [Wenzhouxiangella sp. XN79A]NKI34704.1 aldehyde dehydrogenase family protein [Wenzhouxiangella sp. XN79A]
MADHEDNDLNHEYRALVERLRVAFDSGVTRPLDWRRGQLDAMKSMLEENEGVIAEALHADLRKPPQEVLLGETALLFAEIKHARSRMERWARPRKVHTPAIAQPGRSFIQPDPLGVALIIGAWNYPLQLTLAPLIPAIAAGNCAVLKPSEVAPYTSKMIANLVPRYLDRNAFAVVEGAVPETTALLAQRWDHIFYTGGAAVGKIVMKAAAEHLTPVTLELGGKSPAIVDDTADLKSAARRLAWGKALNAGQTCIAPDYILVSPGRRDALIAEMKKQFTEMLGDNPLASDDYAAVVNEKHFERVAALIAQGEVAIGGRTDPETNKIEPTVLLNPDLDATVMTDEIFGPVLPVIESDDLDASIEFVRRGDKPLSAYLFTRSRASEQRFLSELACGSVCINDVMMFMSNPDLPFGGVGMSGMGQYHGQAGFDRFSHLKSVMKRGRFPDPSIRYAPYSDFKTKLLKWFA